MLNIILQTNTIGVSQTAQEIAANEITFFTLLMKGGVILIPIAILSLIAVYIMVEKYFEIRKSISFNPTLIMNYKNYLRKGDYNSALTNLQASNTSYSRIFQHAVASIGKPIKDIEGTIESASTIEINRLNRNLGYLGLIAGIAPMLGFIGTISGIIKIFYNISVTDNISIGIISGGLYEKMISSGSGLIVGVIAFSGYHLLNMMIDKFLNKIEEEAFDFTNIIQGN